MKFTNGYWLIKEGYKIINPKVAYEIKIEDKKATIYAPCTTIENRGKTLDGGMITIEITSPLEDVLKVRIYHHAGYLKVGPYFEIEDKKLDLVCEESSLQVKIKSGNLCAKVDKENWRIGFYNKEKLITASLPGGIGYVTKGEEESYVKEELSIDVGELIYGLGERFTPFVKNGQSVDIWNADGGTGSEQSYKNIPFYVSNKGYGVFVNHPEKVSFEVASEKVSRVQFSVEGEYLEYFIINGPSLKKVIENYTTLTGKPALPPAWSFGLWLSTSFLTNYDEETVNSFIDGMKERDIPLDVFHFDCFWMREFEWCNFKWDDRMFKNPEKMLKTIKSKGIKTCVWINPYIAQKSPLFNEAVENGYLLKRANGEVWQWDMWQAGMGVVDFTNPKATVWFQNKLEELVDMGVDAFKTDFGERIPTDVVYYDGSNAKKMHNYYTYLYNKTVFDLLKRKKGEKEAVLFARSATVGGQKFPVHWGGDCTSSYTSMAESLRGGLSFTLSGFGFWSHDIGGFENGTTADLYKRWTQFGLLSTHSRYHGSGEYKVPWIYDEEAVEVTRKFTKLKCSLMPYLYKNACETSKTGVPMVRAMVLEFMEDEACSYLDRQYMLGDSLLVAPIFKESGRVRYYIPKGRWTNILTNKVLDGERWYEEEYDYMNLPLLARENSIITFGYIDSKAEYDYTKNPSFSIFELQEEKIAKSCIYDSFGVKKVLITAVKKDDEIKIATNGIKGQYSILLRNIKKVSRVSSGKWKSEADGVKIELSCDKLTIKL
ncbi:alpha-glucosidase [Clostridium acetobutylicum]|nr:alpha-glucosidase [Clostridium acetobutylicum]